MSRAQSRKEGIHAFGKTALMSHPAGSFKKRTDQFRMEKAEPRTYFPSSAYLSWTYRMAQPTAGALGIGAKTHSSVRDGHTGEDTHSVEKLAARTDVGAFANDTVFNDRVGSNVSAGGNN